MRQQYLELFSFAKESNITLRRFRQSTNWTDIFHTPLSIQAWDQLQEMMRKCPPETDNKDIWTCHGKQTFSARIMYKHLWEHNQGSELLSKLWKTTSRLKHKIFFWLVLHNRINTRSMLQRKGMHLDNYCCPCCLTQANETLLHLLWDYNFAHKCWITIIPLKKEAHQYMKKLFWPCNNYHKNSIWK